jgi:hypothetical protein
MNELLLIIVQWIIVVKGYDVGGPMMPLTL